MPEKPRLLRMTATDFGKMIAHISKFVVVDNGLSDADFENETFSRISSVEPSPYNIGHDYPEFPEYQKYRKEEFVRQKVVIFGRSFYGWEEKF